MDDEQPWEQWHDWASSKGVSYVANGHYLAFDTQRDHLPPAEVGIGPEFEIHVMRNGGTCDTRLTSNLVEDRFPAWSPDGSRLAWSEQGHIFLMNANGSNPIDLGPGSFPDWSR